MRHMQYSTETSHSRRCICAYSSARRRRMMSSVPRVRFTHIWKPMHTYTHTRACMHKVANTSSISVHHHHTPSLPHPSNRTFHADECRARIHTSLILFNDHFIVVHSSHTPHTFTLIDTHRHQRRENMHITTTIIIFDTNSASYDTFIDTLFNTTLCALCVCVHVHVITSLFPA